jgi:hypothetical protein
LVAAAHDTGISVTYASDLPVTTSSRRNARAAGGFNSFLHRLGRKRPADPVTLFAWKDLLRHPAPILDRPTGLFPEIEDRIVLVGR